MPLKIQGNKLAKLEYLYPQLNFIIFLSDNSDFNLLHKFVCLSAILQVIRIHLVRHHFDRKTIIRLCRPIQYWR